MRSALVALYSNPFKPCFEMMWATRGNVEPASESAQRNATHGYGCTSALRAINAHHPRDRGRAPRALRPALTNGGCVLDPTSEREVRTKTRYFAFIVASLFAAIDLG